MKPKQPALWALFVLTLTVGGCASLSGNFRTVEEGELYRSGQLHPDGLARRLVEHNIQSVISLRKPEPGAAWYEDEKQTCANLGREHVDLAWTMKALPTPDSLAELLSRFESSQGATLVHCQGGAHRSAVAAAVYLLMKGASVDQAREQFGFWFNDAPIGDLLDLYAVSRKPFRAWAIEDYPGTYARLPDAN